MTDWLEKMGVSILKNQENSQQLLKKFIETARPSSVFSAPLTAGEYTVITASEVYAGLGIGFGGGGGSGPTASDEPADETPLEAGDEPVAEKEEDAPAVGGVGYGGGGGGVTMGRPVAAITIGPDGVTVEPIVDATKVAIALFTTIGAMTLMFSRMQKFAQK
jgi:uncharacterized spore protein YtfJ